MMANWVKCDDGSWVNLDNLTRLWVDHRGTYYAVWGLAEGDQEYALWERESEADAQEYLDYQMNRRSR